MTEYRFYDGTPPVSTFEFHEHRERAPHMEQFAHRPRLMKGYDFAPANAITPVFGSGTSP